MNYKCRHADESNYQHLKDQFYGVHSLVDIIIVVDMSITKITKLKHTYL